MLRVLLEVTAVIYVCAISMFFSSCLRTYLLHLSAPCRLSVYRRREQNTYS